ncbi:hypothetical protein B0H66DRAFT_607771 [Apodospora peruviana]|uniref:Uncharacterized protein n=1 Tax=Apodospora peruviana TaxID=516989 RepID=A0AAE0LYV1_9PEZI|nr:hypothetical protein B0H66DRAFT_607771 [Apodospora peruviana]
MLQPYQVSYHVSTPIISCSWIVLAAELWAYYLDNQKRQLATGEETWRAALDNEVELWGERREHVAHCVYVFLSLAQIIRDGTPYASYFRNYEHMAHCAGVVMDAVRLEPDRDRIQTFVGRVSYNQQCF